MGASPNRAMALNHHIGQRVNMATVANCLMDAAGEMIAWEFRATTTSPIVSANVKVLYGNAAATTNFKLGIFNPTADWKPDTASQLGGYTPEFAGVNSQNAFVGDKTFASNTGNLVVNNLYWLVMEYSSGTALGADNDAQVTSTTNAYNSTVHGNNVAYYTSAAWTIVTGYQITVVLTHADGTVTGWPITAADAAASPTGIYSTYKQGIKYRIGSKHSPQGCFFRISRIGTPDDLIIKVYENSTLKHTENLTLAQARAAAGGSADPLFITFTSSFEIAADADTYMIMSQTGASSSHYWRPQSYVFSADHINALIESTTRMVHGTSSDPTALTVLNNEMLAMSPIISSDSAVHLDCAAGGGGGNSIFGSGVILPLEY